MALKVSVAPWFSCPNCQAKVPEGTTTCPVCKMEFHEIVVPAPPSPDPETTREVVPSLRLRSKRYTQFQIGLILVGILVILSISWLTRRQALAAGLVGTWQGTTSNAPPPIMAPTFPKGSEHPATQLVFKADHTGKVVWASNPPQEAAFRWGIQDRLLKYELWIQGADSSAVIYYPYNVSRGRNALQLVVPGEHTWDYTRSGDH